MEREADRVGYGLMAPAGFAPQGFVSMFDKLQQANRINDNGRLALPAQPSAHHAADRGFACAHSPAVAQSPAPGPTLEHAMMAARARVLSRPGIDVWRQWVNEPQAGGFGAQPLPRRVGAWYAASLSALQLQDMAAARAAQRSLLEAARGDAAGTRQAHLLGAEIELAAGQADAALEQAALIPAAGPQAGAPASGSGAALTLESVTSPGQGRPLRRPAGWCARR